MVDATSPDGIAIWTNSDPTSLVQESQTQGATIQAAFDKRERYDFVWANSSERTSQTGMVQGSRGYQIDTKSEYIYDNSAWRLAVSYIEFTNSGLTVPNVTQTAFGNWTVSSSLSTDTSLVSITNNVITIPNPGVYSLSCTSDGNNNAAGTSAFIDFTRNVNFTGIVAIGGFVAGVCTATIPFLRTTAANTVLYLWIYQNSGSNATVTASGANSPTALRIGRFG